AFPDADAYAIGRLDVDELDVSARRKRGVMFEGGADASESFVVRQRAEDEALRVSDVERDDGQALAAGVECQLADVARTAHRGAKRLAMALDRESLEPLRTGPRDDRHLNDRVRLVAEEDRGEAAHAIARHFRRAAVRVQQRHLRAVVDDQTIAADASMAVAELPRERIQSPAGDVRVTDVQEVVAVRVCFCDVHFVQNASKCHPNRRTSTRGSRLKVPTNSPL